MSFFIPCLHATIVLSSAIQKATGEVDSCRTWPFANKIHLILLGFSHQNPPKHKGGQTLIFSKFTMKVPVSARPMADGLRCFLPSAAANMPSRGEKLRLCTWPRDGGDWNQDVQIGNQDVKNPRNLPRNSRVTYI